MEKRACFQRTAADCPTHTDLEGRFFGEEPFRADHREDGTLSCPYAGLPVAVLPSVFCGAWCAFVLDRAICWLQSDACFSGAFSILNSKSSGGGNDASGAPREARRSLTPSLSHSLTPDSISV